MQCEARSDRAAGVGPRGHDERTELGALPNCLVAFTGARQVAQSLLAAQLGGCFEGSSSGGGGAPRH